MTEHKEVPFDLTSITPDDMRAYLSGGQCYISLESEKTGNHYTYKISYPFKKLEDGSWHLDRSGPLFVSVLYGPDNTKDYSYAGILNLDSWSIKYTAKSHYNVQSPCMLALNYLLSHLYDSKWPPKCKVYHHNHCSVCGRVLTEPESIRLGIGPICRSK